MFSDIQCPNPSFIRIQKSGIVPRIVERGRILEKIFLFKDAFHTNEDEKPHPVERLFRQAEKSVCSPVKGKIEEIRDVHKEIMELYLDYLQPEEEFDVGDEGFGDLLMKYPSYLAYLILGEEVFNPQKFGFPTRRSLEESVTSFCIGEEQVFRDSCENSWVWRTGKYKNEVHLNMHGDLYASQRDVSGREFVQRTLFGDEAVFDTSKKAEVRGAIYAHQDWSEFLVSLLRYAQFLGKERMPEITGWRDVLKSVGEVGTNTSECELGSDGRDFSLPFLMAAPLLADGVELDRMPLIMSMRDCCQVPYVQNGNLVYFREEKNGNVELPLAGKFIDRGKFSPQIEYTSEDLPDALKATYKYFARDKSRMRRIMDAFTQEIGAPNG